MGYIAYNETVDLWMKQFLEKHPFYTTKNIDAEVEEVKGTISNERLWANGANDPAIHELNIADLEEYIARLEEIKHNV